MEEFFDPCGIAESQPSLKPQAYDFGLGLNRVVLSLVTFIIVPNDDMNLYVYSKSYNRSRGS